jgi:hypothetical protein
MTLTEQFEDSDGNLLDVTFCVEDGQLVWCDSEDEFVIQQVYERISFGGF